MKFHLILTPLLLCLCSFAFAQPGEEDLLSQLGDEEPKTEYTYATFKTTRLINGHSVENVGKGVLDFKISHRFGRVNGGPYEFFGLDQATMRMGLDYGITNTLQVGFGRSTFEKTYDGYVKWKFLRQSTGKKKMPVSMAAVAAMAIKTNKWEDPSRDNYFSSRLFYTYQLLVGRKFNEAFSLQLMPTLVHRNLVPLKDDPNDILAMGIGGRVKLTRRISLNAEYYYQIPGFKMAGTKNSLAIGFDIETGGHVFQLHFCNSRGMEERSFISQTNGDWLNGDIHFGFNISRVFTIVKPKLDME